jgi:precorrin-6B methylase 2
MLAYYLFVLALILVLVPWLWRYKVRPYLAKKDMRQSLANVDQGSKVLNQVKQLELLYQRVFAEAISRLDRSRLGFNEDAFIYGEIDFLSFILILQKIEPKPNEIYYDLGSGSGKSVLAAALSCHFSKSCGIELLPGLVKLAHKQLERAKQLWPSADLSSIEFIQGDFLLLDFSDADVVFINATCLHYQTWQALTVKLASLKPGSRVITTTKKLLHQDFKLLYEGRELMSWGMNSVNIYVKIR